MERVADDRRSPTYPTYREQEEIRREIGSERITSSNEHPPQPKYNNNNNNNTRQQTYTEIGRAGRGRPHPSNTPHNNPLNSMSSAHPGVTSHPTLLATNNHNYTQRYSTGGNNPFYAASHLRRPATTNKYDTQHMHPAHPRTHTHIIYIYIVPIILDKINKINMLIKTKRRNTNR